MIVAGTVEAMTVMTMVVVTAALQGVPLTEAVIILLDAHLMVVDQDGPGPFPTLRIKAQREVMGVVFMQGEVGCSFILCSHLSC